MSGDKQGSNPRYILGHTKHELRRLRSQARLLEPVTRHFLLEAGVVPGMRVLDIGCGHGDVAILAAELVGEAGMVLGVDKVPAAIAAATQAAREHGLANVQFREGDPTEMKFDTPFDAVVGRYVLPYQTNPSAMLRGLVQHVAPGGLMVFHEPDWTFVRSLPPTSLYEQACRWVDETTRKSGQSWNFLGKTHTAFVNADLPSPTIRLHTLVAGEAKAHEWLLAVGDIVESLLPTIVELGVATEEEVDLDTLRDRLLKEVDSTESVIVGRSEVGAWTMVPG